MAQITVMETKQVACGVLLIYFLFVVQGLIPYLLVKQFHFRYSKFYHATIFILWNFIRNAMLES